MRFSLPRIIIGIIIVLLGVFYCKIDPELHVWVPKCPWWLLTNTYCPSCGIQRFLHSLLTGNIYKAFCLNPFLLISIPYAVLAVLGKWYNINGVFDKTNKFVYHRFTLLAYAVLYIVWWIVRIIFKV